MLELARPADWEAVNRLSRQVQDLHVSWRPDIYRSSEAPMPKDFFMEAIAQRMLYVAKVNEEVVGYVHLSMEKKDYDLSKQMVSYLCSFAATGTPRGIGYPTWHPLGKQVMILGEKPSHMGKPNLGKMVYTMLTNPAVGE